MKLTYLFRRLVFAQAILGIIASCMAERNPVLLLVAGTLAMLSWYVVEGPAGRPLSRGLIMIGAMIATACFTYEFYRSQGQHLIPAIAHFIMWLQILLLYSRKDNREYGQILALSLMQMISASVMTGELIFGLLLAAYAVTALFTLLLFQLKVTGDLVQHSNQVAAAPGERVQRTRPVVGRQHRVHFRLTALAIGTSCAAIAALLFILLPRTDEFNFKSNVASPWKRPAAGFTSQLSLRNPPPRTASREIVLHLDLQHSKRAIEYERESWLLRGAVMDRYHAATQNWNRVMVHDSSHTVPIKLPREGMDLMDFNENWGAFEAQVTLLNPGDRHLFTLHPVSSVRCINVETMTFNPYSQQLEIVTKPTGPVIYHVRSPDLRPQPMSLIDAYLRSVSDSNVASRLRSQNQRIYDARGWMIQPMRIRRLTQQVLASANLRRNPRQRVLADVGPQFQAQLDEGTVTLPLRQVIKHGGVDLSDQATSFIDGQGQWCIADHTALLTARREGDRISIYETFCDPNDYAICRALTDYLSNEEHFEYTLEAPPSANREDPIVRFLFKDRKGHCELFASALAAMTRSIGMRARVVAGYRAREFNRIGGYYVIRHSNAHAWTEVETAPSDWRTFDPSPREALEIEQGVGYRWLNHLRQLYEHLEFTWGHSVVSYNREVRSRIFGKATRSATQIATDPTSWPAQTLRRAKAYYKRHIRLDDLTQIIASVIMVFIVIGVISFLRLTVARRRRLIALQLTRLPHTQRKVLARQLRFYLTMLDMLERRGQIRPSWQSPFGFAQELAAKQPHRFGPVVALTELFYEIRFGYCQLDEQRRRQIQKHLGRLEQTLKARV